MTLTFLHTAEVHRSSFDTLAVRIAPETKLTQHVRVDWLARAQDGIDDALGREIAAMIKATEGPVVCSCTTLGPVAAAAGAIRIDQPMMAKAAEIGGDILMVYCLESTRVPSAELLQAEIDLAGNGKITPLFLGEFWPLFEAGEFDKFATAIAGAIRFKIGQTSNVSSVVLAQASMASAKDLLLDLSVPVLASPELALRAGLLAMFGD